jgi:predicted translin family RNA/ssDNA-binding protein
LEVQTGDREVLLSLLREASRQSAPFQSLIHNYSLDVMHDPAVHLLFTTRLNQNLPMLRRIDSLKTSFESSDTDASDLSTAMKEVLEAASALSASSHTNMGEIVNLVAVELAYRRMDQGLDPPLVSPREAI